MVNGDESPSEEVELKWIGLNWIRSDRIEIRTAFPLPTLPTGILIDNDFTRTSPPMFNAICDGQRHRDSTLSLSLSLSFSFSSSSSSSSSSSYRIVCLSKLFFRFFFCRYCSSDDHSSNSWDLLFDICGYLMLMFDLDIVDIVVLLVDWFIHCWTSCFVVDWLIDWLIDNNDNNNNTVSQDQTKRHNNTKYKSKTIFQKRHLFVWNGE